MEPYVSAVFHQLKIAVDTAAAITELVGEEELELRLGGSGRTVRELLVHLALVCRADALIMNEASQAIMSSFYREQRLSTMEENRRELGSGYTELYKMFSEFTGEELNEDKTSYWGVRCSRFEWLLEILCHVCHHRAQLHTVLRLHGRELPVQLFE